jgi:hypothetical protein
MAFVATLAALALSLLIASAKTNYDLRGSQLHAISADVIALDRALSRYGPDAQSARGTLRAGLSEELKRIWSHDGFQVAQLGLDRRDSQLMGYDELIEALVPHTENQHFHRSRALQIANGLISARVQMTQDLHGSIPYQLLLVLGSWLAVLFFSFGCSRDQ